MLLDLEDTIELLRGVPIPCWLFLSVVFLSAHMGPVSAVQDFTAYRMQHLDLHGVHYGSRSAVVNMEARGENAEVLNRKSVVVRWVELTSERFLDLINRGAGSLLVLLPPDTSGGEGSVIESWRELESDLLSSEVSIPVYFAPETEGLTRVYEEISENAERERNSTVAAMLWSIVTGYGYQVASEDQRETEAVKDPHIVTLMGKLTGQGVEQSLPTIALVAHYDAFGLVPSLSFGVDSNGSGVAALLELVRLFSRLYGSSDQRPKYNLLFVLTGGGKLNYFGTRAFLDDQLDDPDSSLLPDADYTLCLDSLAARGSGLFLHVSKPPKEGMKTFSLFQALNQSAQQVEPGFEVGVVHKKIRLSEDLLAWEHERFSLKRVPAATLSALPNHRDLRRSSMFVDRSDVDIDVLVRNMKVLAEGLARYIYNLSSVDDVEVFSGSQSVHRDYLEAWLEFLSRHPRSPQLLHKDHPVVTALQETLSRYLQDVTRVVHKPEKGDPEFVVYTIPSTTMHAYRVKAAIFDLFLAIGIVLYVLVWYLVVSHFQWLMPYLTSMSSRFKVKRE